MNEAGFEVAALVEDRNWTREALTAPEVVSLQAFRDMFSEATLRPGDEAAVGQVALLFSDLTASTALYSKAGDAYAFRLVVEHFDLLQAITEASYQRLARIAELEDKLRFATEYPMAMSNNPGFRRECQAALKGAAK